MNYWKYAGMDDNLITFQESGIHHRTPPPPLLAPLLDIFSRSADAFNLEKPIIFQDRIAKTLNLLFLYLCAGRYHLFSFLYFFWEWFVTLWGKIHIQGRVLFKYQNMTFKSLVVMQTKTLDLTKPKIRFKWAWSMWPRRKLTNRRKRLNLSNLWM